MKKFETSVGPRSSETPTIADMDGDGKMDLANFETTTTYGRNGHFGVMLSTGSSVGSYRYLGHRDLSLR